MTATEALRALVKVLNEREFPFMFVGSYSSNFYGVPRSTKAADLVLNVDSSAWGEIAGSLPKGIRFEGQGFFEMVTATRKELIRIDGSDFQIELFHLSDDDFDQARFARRVQVGLPDFGKVWLPTPEDVVVQKLRWAQDGSRQKDVDDVVAILRVQDTLDFDYLESWCRKHGTLDLLARVRAEAR